MVTDAEQGGEVLSGGVMNEGSVIRFGNEVRRPCAPPGSGVHRVLAYLHDAGFDGAPELLRVDGAHEWLRFVPGQTVPIPLPDWCFDHALLASVGDLLRRLHEALRGFAPRPGETWGQVVPPRWAGQAVCHGDVVRSNVILRGRRAVALIDFDMCVPARPVWEAACAVRHWIPLRGEGPEGLAAAPAVTVGRLRAFLDAFELDVEGRGEFVDAVLDAEVLQMQMLRSWVDSGSEAYAQIWRGGAPDRIRQRIDWVGRHRRMITDGLLA